MFICSNCGYGSASWMGRCPNCNEWNTLVQRKEEDFAPEALEEFKLTDFSKIKTDNKQRIKTEVFEFDRVLGGGFVPGEVILLTGEPGVGKSTLLLQSLKKISTLYISGEESAEQIKDRAERLKINLKNLSFSPTTQVESILSGLENLKDKVDIAVIDSVQTLYSKKIESQAGSVAQLKEAAGKLISTAKKLKIPIILVGHITKEGDIAGPKTMEHFVDCVLNFEGEKISNFRILRATKNRFGSTDEIGIFEMKGEGLAEVNDPMAFVEDRQKDVAGRATVGVAEGKRPLFFEIQTLTVPTVLAVPRRVVKGVDYNKTLLLLAVLRKNLGLPLDKFDIYVNVVGGVTIKSTAADLGIIASLISSVNNIAIPQKTVFTAEVGLLGEIRKTPFEDKILSEAKRLRFNKIITSRNISHIKDLKKTISA